MFKTYMQTHIWKNTIFLNFLFVFLCAEVEIMSCSVAYQDTSQLSCIFPENVENALAVFYSPDSGSESNY